ncbi:uncharacterized protein UBRO_20239 [Ustilago bromivora]|uniref:Reverse transcriptase Ty1/copia-type domain-containing protein n=1 Tax=Ustilago bromivora TaxID=307758 RepID=A0A1K0FWM6_9BASI|nr:uncharacterized protein UBRO_20239 [Ustilago bromivora]
MTHAPLKAPPDSEIDKELKARYPILVGKLLWISNTVRPDISYAVNTLACHISKLTKEAMQVALQVVKYLNQTQDEVLRLGGGNGDKPVIFTYTDLNWASDPNTDRRNSAVEVEYVAELAAMHKGLFHWHLLHGLSFRDLTLLVLTDNTRCVQVTKDQVLHSRLKHINMKYHLICNHVMEGDVTMHYMKTDTMMQTTLLNQCHNTCLHALGNDSAW